FSSESSPSRNAVHSMHLFSLALIGLPGHMSRRPLTSVLALLVLCHPACHRVTWNAYAPYHRPTPAASLPLPPPHAHSCPLLVSSFPSTRWPTSLAIGRRSSIRMKDPLEKDPLEKAEGNGNEGTAGGQGYGVGPLAQVA